MIKLHDLYFKPFISEKEINAAVEKMVDAIAADLGDEMPVFIGILNGSFMFVSDFVKKYPKPLLNLLHMKVLNLLTIFND